VKSCPDVAQIPRDFWHDGVAEIRERESQ